MTHTDIQDLVTRGESERLEFKKSTGQRTEAAKTICAMLNGPGGQLVFGVTDQGKIVGQKVTTRTIEDLAHEFRRIDPQVTPAIETIDLSGGLSVIVVSVLGGGGPYTYDDRPYIRLGPVTQRMDKHQYKLRLTEGIQRHAHVSGGSTFGHGSTAHVPSSKVEEGIRQSRDRETVTDILAVLPTPVLDEFVDRLHIDMVTQDIFYFWECFNGLVSSGHFYIYDPQLRSAVTDLHRAWRGALSYGDYFIALPGGHSYRLMSAHEMRNEQRWKTVRKRFLVSVATMENAYNSFLSIVKTRFVDIDLWKTSMDAISRRVKHEKRFRKQIGIQEPKRKK